jgi:hypothetical protein
MRPRSCLVPFSLLLLAGCTGAGETSGVPPRCRDATGTSYTACRVFRGRLLLPHAVKLPLEVRAFQVVGVGFEATGGAGGSDAGGARGADAGVDGGGAATDKVRLRLFYGPVFAHEEGGGLRPDVPFSVVVPCGLSVNLLLQVPAVSGDHVPGRLVAHMAFDDGGSGETTLIPRQPADACGDASDLLAPANTLDLGQVPLALKKAGVITSGSITLGDGNSRNPLALVDADGDGTTDLSDTDDDDDGEADTSDVDDEGDGIVDASQMLGGLTDEDQDLDGLPDSLQ